MAGGEPELVYVEEVEPERADTADEAFSARITLRLPETLKASLEAAAAASGVSVNTWLVQTLSRLLAPRPAAGRTRHRLTGYGRS
jgi:predicted HicB family RNase H-like nuclease